MPMYGDEVTLTSDILVEVRDKAGGDRRVAEVAWETTGKDAEAASDEEVRRLLRMLMRDKHGSAFEFGMLHVKVTAPLFVFRQWHRHRVGHSYAEASGRWHRPGTPPPLGPVFWVPREGRPLVPGEGHKPTAPKLQANEYVRRDSLSILEHTYRTAWSAYKNMLGMGVAAEVARVALPLSVYSRCHVQVNPRSLMHFLALRVKDDGNKYSTNPQLEIQEAALACEEVLQAGWPLTYEAWNEFGRVAP